MKTTSSKDKTSKTVTVELMRSFPEAKRVCIAGNLNDWRTDRSAMRPLSNGGWARTLILKPGIYEYRLLVDGQWVDDPSAAETVPNPFGSRNAVLKIE